MARLIVRDSASLAKTTTPFPYQQEAIDAIRGLPYAAVFFEQGLGKTKIAIDLTLDWLAEESIDAVIVVTKKGLIKNWRDEFAIHSHVKPRVLSSDRTANHRAFFSETRVFLTNYETIAAEKERIKTFAEHLRLAAILDESQKIKNPDSALTNAFLELSSYFSRRVIMTGTPMANRPFDIWSQIFFLDSGNALGNDFRTFKEKLDLAAIKDVQSYSDDLTAIFPKISSFCLRQTKEGSGLELPGKQYSTEVASWEEIQRRMYDAVRFELRVQVERDGVIVVDDTESLLKRLLRLVQIASNPITIDASCKSVPGKLPILKRLIQKIVDSGEKAIVWTSFVPNCRFLKSELTEFGAVQVNGQMSIDERHSSLSKFKKQEDVNVLVATPAAAKEGLTLTVANHVIFYDRSFSLDDYLQAQDRIHRISQTRVCFVHNIVLPNSIDEWIGELIHLKSSAARVGMGDSNLTELTDAARVDLDHVLDSVLNGQ